MGDQGSAVTALALSPNGSVAAAADVSGGVRLWDLERRKGLWTDRRVGAMHALAFSPDGKSVAAGGLAHRVQVWDVTSGTRVASFAHPDYVRAVEYSANGSLLLGAGGRFVRLWRIGDGEVVQNIVTASVTTADLDQGGTRIATGGLDGIARLWDVATGKLLHELEGHDGPVTKVAFDASGQRLVTAGEDGTARLWDVARGELLQTLAGHTDAIRDTEFSPDGSNVALASLDGDGSFWSVRTGVREHVLRGHFNPVYALAFDPTGRWIVTGSQRTAGLWPVSSGLLSAYLRGHELPVTSVEFAPSSWRVVTASEDGTVRTWTCATCGEIPELFALATTRLALSARTLTEDEQERYLG